MIEINKIEARDEKRQIAFFTIDGQEFSCGNVPVNLVKMEDIQAYLKSRADEFKLLILRKQYPESDHLRFKINDKTELDAMEEWITKGHKNKVQIGKDDKEKPIYENQVIEKKELEYHHPAWIGIQSKIDSLNIAKELKDVLKEIVKK